MSTSAPIGRWLDTVTKTNTTLGDLVWMPVAKGGRQAQVVMMSDKVFAVLAPKAAGKHRQWSVRCEGFMWSCSQASLPGSVVRKFSIKESPAGAFKTVVEARAAVVEAHRLLAGHLQLEAA